MAIVTTVKWLFPPNWDKTEQKIEGYRRIVVQLTGLQDETADEDAVKKIDISVLLTTRNLEVTRTVIEKIKYSNYGFTNILLEWDRSPKETIAVLPGNTAGEICGPLVDKDDGLNNGEGNTGDILLTTSGGAAGDSYNITLTVKLKDSAPAPIQGD
jgi:hypothetical protein